MLIVGIDCATNRKKTGLTRSTIDGSQLIIHEARVAKSRDDIVATVASWMLTDELEKDGTFTMFTKVRS